MQLIDFRFRPNTKEIIEGFANSNVFREGLIKAGIDLQEFNNRARTMLEIVDDLQKNNVLQAVLVGRDAQSTCGLKSNNDEIYQFSKSAPKLFSAFAGIDPHKKMKAIYELQNLVENKGFKGAAIDPIYAQITADDRLYYAIYAKCCELNVPIIITSGPARYTANTVMSYAHPNYIDRVACDFPELKIVVSHGAWPYVQEMIGVAFRNKNIYIELSEYENFPLSEQFIKAGNEFLQKQIVFGSAHPVVPYLDAAKMYSDLKFSPEVKENIMWKNAKELLNL